MSNHLQNKIYIGLNRKNTNELLEIWNTHDEKLWSADAFSVIKQILLERQVELPEESSHMQKVDDTNISSTKKSAVISLKKR